MYGVAACRAAPKKPIAINIMIKVIGHILSLIQQ